MTGKLGTMGAPTQDTARMERSDKLRVSDLLKILDELRMLRTRSHNQDLSRLEEQHHQAVEAAVKEAGKRGKSGSPEEIG